MINNTTELAPADASLAEKASAYRDRLGAAFTRSFQTAAALGERR